eukprot:scaffold18754_cov54-Phaeocystis_antarctica.AAC.5
MLDSCFHASVRGSYASTVLRVSASSLLPPRTYTRRGPQPERRNTCPTFESESMMTLQPATEASAGHARTVVCRKPASIAAKRTCFIAASSSATGRSPASHHRTAHRKMASSFLATSPSSCTSVSTCAPDADCGGSSSKPPRADVTAAFSSTGSV